MSIHRYFVHRLLAVASMAGWLGLLGCETSSAPAAVGADLGTVSVDITPDSIQAPWQLVMPDGNTFDGVGDLAIRALPPGQYVLNLLPVSGYGTPGPRVLTLEAGGQVDFAATYVARTSPVGSLRIEAQPDSLDPGWVLLDGGDVLAYGTGDSTVQKLPVGEHRLVWTPLEEWSSPQPNPVFLTIEPGVETTVRGVYEYTGANHASWVVLEPVPAGLAAPWTVFGPNSYAAAGIGADRVSVPVSGDYSVTWGNAPGFVTPGSDRGTVAEGDSLVFRGTYVPALGTVRIDVTPDGIGAPWTLSNDSGDEFSGTDDTVLPDIPVGSYTISWGNVPGFASPTPGLENFFLGVGEERTVAQTYELPPATIRVRVSAPDGPWRLTGPGLDRTGTGNADLPGVAPGSYTIVWQALTGWITPVPAQQTLSVSTAQTITFYGAYQSTAGPRISGTSALGPNGSSLTISGEAFGFHPLDIASSVGPNGWIEQNAVGTSVDQLTGANGWGVGFSTSKPAYIDNRIVRTGSHSINASVDIAGDGDWQKAIRYFKADTFEKVYASWWVNLTPQAGNSTTQWKMWWVGAHNLHSRCGSVSGLSRWNAPARVPNQFKTEFYGGRSVGGILECVKNVTPHPYYAPLNGDPFEYIQHDHAQTEPIAVNLPESGRWARIEVYLDSSTLNGFDGEFEYFITREGQERKLIDSWTGLRTHISGCYWSAYPQDDPGQRWRYFGLHGLWDDDGFGGERATIVYDDVYVQFGTKARVELGNSAIYESCSQLEVQSPTAWAETSVTVDLNYGTFPSGSTAYLFVIDENGDSSPGWQVTIP